MGRGIGSYVRVDDKKKILSQGRCGYCGSTNQLCIEHIHPLNKGGDSRLSNLTLACNKCNSYKWDFTLAEFFGRVIDKMNEAYHKAIKFFNIAYKHRNKRPEEYKYNANKGLENYRVFKYFNKIRISIIYGTYKVHG